MIESNLPLWILLLPLIGFLLNGVALPLWQRGFSKASAHQAGIVATLAIGISFILY